MKNVKLQLKWAAIFVVIMLFWMVLEFTGVHDEHIDLHPIVTNFFANASRYSVVHGLLTQQAAEEYFNLKKYLLHASIDAPITALFARRKSVA